MSHVRRILKNFTVFFMSFLLTAMPYAGVSLPVLETKADDCLLNVSLISDTHLEKYEPLRQLFLVRGLRNIRHARSEVDALVVCGDLTNYGDTASMDTFFNICEKYNPTPTLLPVFGNHDIGHVKDRDHDDVREDLIARTNALFGTQNETIYYATEIGGYSFIVLCDEGDRWDYCAMSPEQLSFLDVSLSEATKDGKPAFVCCHWPLEDMNGQKTIWPGSGIDLAGQDVKSILEKYRNVFYISGHMHAGLKSHAVEERYDLSNAETVNGVTYINLPTYGLVNWFGYPWSCTGAQLEVYADRVLFRPRSFATGYWFVNSEYTFALQ